MIAIVLKMYLLWIDFVLFEECFKYEILCGNVLLEIKYSIISRMFKNLVLQIFPLRLDVK